jgi:hypothetical protein
MVGLVAVFLGCGTDDGGGEPGNGSGGGGGAGAGAGIGGAGGGTSAGGAAATGGTSGVSSSGGSATATLADHEAACRSFCEKYKAQCGVDCPETCDGYANTYELVCAGLGVDYFTCLSKESTSDYDCDAGIIQRITDGCAPEEDDLVACFYVDGVACEREADEDAEDCASKPATPYAYYCVSSAAPADCVATANGEYCCPTP